MDDRTSKQKYLSRLSALKTERATWDPQWLDLSNFIQPRMSRFIQTDRNRGDRKGQEIINGSPTWAAGVLAAGMVAGITSPARRWARITTPDPKLAEVGAVKEWLRVTEDRIFQTYAQSNIYNSLHDVYLGIGTFGTAAMVVEADSEEVIRAYVLPIGQYCLANSAKRKVNAVFREFSMTVGQLVEDFKLKNCSQRVRDLYGRGDHDSWVDVVHVIAPNLEQEVGRGGYRGMPWKSCWFERNGNNDPKQFLREGGYEEFPALCPRWQVLGEDVWGSSPGMEAIGDARSLQLLEKRKMQAFEKVVNPPMTGPMTLMHQRASLLPGDVTYADGPAGAFRTAMDINPLALREFREEIRETSGRIKTAYKADLWLMMQQDQAPEMTAREVAERHEEKMFQLGPVMERLDGELLKPLISRTVACLFRANLLPPPPKELQGTDVKVEFISIMAQAQKMLGIGGVKQLASFTLELASVKPDVLDKLNLDQVVDAMGGMLSVPPSLVRTDEAVAAIRADRAKAQQQQQQMAMAAQAVDSAQTLSQTDTSSDNGLTRLLGAVNGPVAAAEAGGGPLQ